MADTGTDFASRTAPSIGSCSVDDARYREGNAAGVVAVVVDNIKMMKQVYGEREFVGLLTVSTQHRINRYHTVIP